MYDSPTRTLDDRHLQNSVRSNPPSYSTSPGVKNASLVETCTQQNHLTESSEDSGDEGQCRKSRSNGWRRMVWGRGESNKCWKPMTLQAPLLGGVVVVSVLMVVILEILSHISSGNGNWNGGGVAFASNVKSVSTLAIFLYLPTILAVIYSMIWSWIDLDAKRIEPWFQLSKQKGATAYDSLLMQYPFDFLPFIPLAAFRRRHWGAFFAGSIMLMVFWVLTPLQSAIFNTGTVRRSISSTMVTTSALVPLDSQNSSLNANFLNAAYGISWLSQKLPQFTIEEFAFLPFAPADASPDLTESESWRTTVNAYSTNLTCTPANVSLNGLGYTFDNGKGCSVSQINLADTQEIADYMVTYIGYYDNPEVDWALQNPNCSVKFSNTFLAVWASAASHAGNGIYNNMTAQFCETSYHTRWMYVEVNSSNTRQIDTPVPAIMNDSITPVEAIFNITNFEYLLATGVNPTSQRADLQDDSVLEQFPRIQDYSIAWPVTNMVGFAVALNPLTVEALVDPATLHTAFQRAHQLLFTTAFSQLTDYSSGPLQEAREGTRHDTIVAIVMVRSISIIVEITLGVISIFTLCLWYVSYRHQSNLMKDPAAIADVMSIIGSSTTSTESLLWLRDDGTLTEEQLGENLWPHRFKLEMSLYGRQASVIRLDKAAVEDISPRANCVEAGSVQSSNQLFTPVRPLELRIAVGATLVGVLIVSLVTLTFLEIFTTENNGIALPSDNPLVLSILENYLPTAFSTFLEPVWVILNRLLCLLQPFDEMRKGDANPAASVESQYSSVPPQLAFYRALKARHFLLAAVCTVAISSNILAVALSGLVFESPTTRVLPLSTSQSLLPQFNGTSIFNRTSVVAPITYLDHFYVAMSNLSDGTNLPPWIDEKFFYLPFKLDSAPTTSNTGIPLQFQGFKGTTVGFGTEPTCIELSTEGDSAVHFQPATNDTSVQFTTSYTFPNGSTVTCFPHTANSVLNETTQFTSSPGDGPSALEVMRVMTPANNTENTAFCGSIMVAGWVRLGTNSIETITRASNTTFLGRSLNYTFLSCTQRLRVAPFDVTVDVEGHILQANRIGPFINDTSSYFSGNASENALFQQSNGLIAPPTIDGFTWHNDSFTSDWMNVLMGMSTGSDTLVNPSSQAPTALNAAPLFESTFQGLFAILIGLNRHIFAPTPDNDGMTVGILVVESKIFVSRPMFILSITILVFHLIVAILYYTHRPKRFLPRMPTSIGSIIAFVSASQALEDFVPGMKDSKNEERRYGYGRFVGTDGKTHVGIERERYVVPLKSQNPEIMRRRRWFWGREKEDEKEEVKSWI